MGSLGKSARSVLDRNPAGENTSAMFLGLIKEAGKAGETTSPEALKPVFPIPSRRERRLANHERLRHRLIVTALIIGPMAALYAIQLAIWPHNPLPRGLRAEIYSWMGAIWAVAAIPALMEAIGLYLWRPPLTPPGGIVNMVCWRIVSRGINREALAATIGACRREMKLTPLFPYVIEVVVDSNKYLDGLPAEGHDLRYIVVPEAYQTPKGTKAKARALHYALHESPISPDTYIVHMDEESWPTRSGIIGLAAAMREEERDHPDRPHIGQGTITYHRDWEEHPYFTLSDCIRSGSDKGRSTSA